MITIKTKIRLNPSVKLLIIMLLFGSFYGLVFHYIAMPYLHNRIIYCVMMGALFSFLNYFIILHMQGKYTSCQLVNKSLEVNLKTDKLTGLLNRKALDDDIAEANSTEKYSLIFIDIDNFRSFNNNYGHQIGDEILKKVSQTIRAIVRADDKVYRYGGEEILVFLKNCGSKSAYKIAEKIRFKISKLDNSPFPQITVSLGIASMPHDGSDFTKVIYACDGALLTAKKQGKNRVILY